MSEPSPLSFPCRFPIKVMGPANADFEARAVAAVRRHVPDLGEGAVRRRDSRAGTYLSLTITVHASSREQLDAVYRALTALDGVLMVL